jgi:hypothetical protein
MLAGCNTLAGSGVGSAITTSVLALWLASLSLVGFLVGCGGGSSSGSFDAGSGAVTTTTTTTGGTVTPTPAPTPGQAVPTKLGFQTQPSKTAGKSEAFAPITPAPQVAILDQFGNLVTTATNAVTISLGTNPGNAVLRGTLTVNAVNGIATFSDLQISHAGAGYTLVASSTGLTGTESVAFTVGPLSFGYQATLQFMTGAEDSRDLALGDFNHDGIADVVALDNNRDGVVAMLGNGDGTFKAPQFSAGGSPQGAIRLVTGDLNHDGRDDVVVGDYGGFDVSVLLSNGDGTFQAPRNVGLVDGALAIAIGDLDGDGIPDLVATEYYEDDVAVFRGNGDGTFAGPSYPLVSGGPNSVVVADFNGDNRLDIATGNYGGNSVSVLLGNGDLTFQPEAQVPIASPPDAFISAVDVNGDGKRDLEVGSYYDPVVTVLLGNGDGAFAVSQNIGLGFKPPAPVSITVGDFTGDGKPDIAYVGGGVGFGGKGGPRHPHGTGNKIASLRASYDEVVAGIFVGNGDGTFAPGPSLAAGVDPFAIVAGDLQGDGHVDLLTVGNSPYGPYSNVSVIVSNGDGSFQQTAKASVEPAPTNPVMTDLNGDGVLDLVVPSVGAGDLSVLLGKGDGTFLPGVNYPTAPAAFIPVVGDFNGDAIEDVAVGTWSGKISVLLGNGDGTLKPAVNYDIGGEVDGLVAGDFNQDGKTDLAAADYDNRKLSLLLGNGDGTFKPALNTPVLAGQPSSLATADLNGDGHLDLVAGGGNFLSTFLGNGDGTFAAANNLAVGEDLQFLVLRDVNGDGKLDAVATAFTEHVELLLGQGDGTFQAPISISPVGAFSLSGLAVDDINADGIPDIVVGDFQGNQVIPLIGNGDGTFVQQTGLATGPAAAGLTIGDLNGDGKVDFVSADYYSRQISIMLHK